MELKLRKLKEKRIQILICLAALVLGISIYSVSAYLMDVSGEVVNEFSPESVKISLSETDTGKDDDGNSNTNTYEMKVGKDITKDPKITVPEDTADCWVYVKMEKSDRFGEYLWYEMAEGWEALGEEYPGIYYKAVAKSDNEQVLQVLEGDTVKLRDGVDEYVLNLIETPPTLTVTAYSVQQASFNNNPADAWGSVFTEED